MKTNFYSGLFLVLLMIFAPTCREPYIAPDVKTNANYLVVDGFLNAGNEPSVLTLSRTHPLQDSSGGHVPELSAQIAVLGPSGEVFYFDDLGNGTYSIATMSLIPGQLYRLQILTKDGKKYLSDSIPVSITPPIDSISWKQDTTSASNKLGLTVYANTHDPQNATRYYRWEFAETWEYHTRFDSFFDYESGDVVPRQPAQDIYSCWHNAVSTSLILASSAKLSQDVIFEAPLTFIPAGDQRLGVRYSILVKQFAMSKEAYEYWENLKKNTELTGSIFDPQPSQLTGNIHCVTDPQEPALGFINASTIQSQRIFIDATQVEHWGFETPPGDCPVIIVPPDSFAYFFGGKQLTPISQVPNSPKYQAARAECVDCTLQGGNTAKPPYWP